ncbi:AtpZ/AtpI family protein [Klenkia marina]|nr:AtpZ/AtpI family protein [Klenkia marina]
MDSASTQNGGHGRRPTPSDESHPSGADVGWGITGTLLSGLVVWGGAGWLLDRWLETRVFVVIGMLLGLASAIYLVVTKYGGATDAPVAISSTSYSKISSKSYTTYRRTPGGRRSRPRAQQMTQKGHR